MGENFTNRGSVLQVLKASSQQSQQSKNWGFLSILYLLLLLINIAGQYSGVTEYIPKRGNFSVGFKFDLNIKMLPRTRHPPFLHLFARTLVNDEKCDVQFKFGTYYSIILSNSTTEVIFWHMMIHVSLQIELGFNVNFPLSPRGLLLRSWRWLTSFYNLL